MLIFPKGALMPSVALDLNDRPIVAYSLYDKDKGGGPTGIGNNNLLGYAVLSGTSGSPQTARPRCAAWSGHASSRSSPIWP